jgi:hypothetical protein
MSKLNTINSLKDNKVVYDDIPGKVLKISKGCKIVYTTKNNVMIFKNTQEDLSPWKDKSFPDY